MIIGIYWNAHKNLMIKEATRSGLKARFSWAVTPAKVNKTIRRIVEIGNPRKIIIFGSYASGRAKENSDLDVLVVKKGPVRNTRLESARLRYKLGDIMMPMDILVIPESRLTALEKRRDLIYHEALKTGRIVYETAEG